jgi:hypothetical protein
MKNLRTEKTKTGDAKFQADMRKFMKTMDSRLTALEKKKPKMVKILKKMKLMMMT